MKREAEEVRGRVFIVSIKQLSRLGMSIPKFNMDSILCSQCSCSRPI